MNRLILFILSFLLLIIIAGKELSAQTSKHLDNSFEIDNVVVICKPDLKFNSIKSIHKDTLNLVVCSKYVYFPFGSIQTKSELENSLLNQFSIEDRIDKEGNVCQILKYKSSHLFVFFDDNSEGPISSYIIKGELLDSDVILTNNIRIGMPKKEFYNIFFESYPQSIEERFNEFGLFSCVDGTNHYYSFKNNELIDIKFECPDCTWQIDF